jgi:MFS transporter, DHA1 family, multidrug resistance protein
MLNRDSLAFTVFLGALVAIPPLSTDVGLPAYGATAAALHVPEASMALTLSLFMLGFAVGPLFYGPISERFGRKPVLLAGLTLYLVTSALCTITPSFSLLLACRLVQGAAASSGNVLAMACIRDLFDGAKARRKISYVMIINGVMPLTAPTIGVFILALGDWRTIYGLMTVCGVLLLLGTRFGLQESIAQKKPNALELRQLIHDYKTVLTHPVSIRGALVSAMCFGMLFTFISGSPILFIHIMRLPASLFGYVFAATTLGAIGGTYLNTRLLRRKTDPHRILGAGLIVMAGGTTALLLLSLSNIALLPLMVFFLFAANFGNGMAGPNAAYAVVQDMPHLAGQASAVLSSVQMIFAALPAALVAALFAVIGPHAMAAEMFGFVVIACGIYFTRPRPTNSGPTAQTLQPGE